MTNIKDISLLSNRTKSCGCFKKENPNCFKHGLKKLKEYRVWTPVKLNKNKL